MSDPYHSIHEMRCCVKGKNADGFGYSSTANEIAAGLGKRLDGKLVIVTGASSGVGKHAARAFYETGATVIMACRNEAKARDTMKWIESSASAPKGKGKLVFVQIDLSSLESVKSFANAIMEMTEPLAVLMCNAGIMTTPFTLTGDGFESQFQINYLSHYYLTMLLVEKLKANPDGARLVNISSISAAWVPFPACCGGCCSRLCGFGPVDFSGGGAWPAKSGACCSYEPMDSYAYSKAAQVIFGSELDRRVFAGTKVIALSVEPGSNPTTSIHMNGRGSMCLQFMFYSIPTKKFIFYNLTRLVCIETLAREKESVREQEGKKKITEVKTFPVPYQLEEINESLIINTNTPSKPSKEKLINQAFQFHSQGNISEAAKYYQYFINQGFKDHRVFFNYGIVLKNLGKLKDAELSYRKAIEINPDFADAHSNLGNILNDLGKLDEAIVCYEKAIDTDQNLESALEGIGRSLLKKGNHSDGLLKIREAIGSIGFNPKKSYITIN